MWGSPRTSAKNKQLQWPWGQFSFSTSATAFWEPAATGGHRKGQLTPANAEIQPKNSLLRKDRQYQQRVQVHAFHQQPVVVCSHTVLHHHKHQTAAKGFL